MPKVLLVGSGRLAQHLIYWNSLSKKPNDLITWNRLKNSKDEFKNSLAKAEIVWLAISDSALFHFYEQNLTSTQIPVVHFSGAFHDPRLISAHPLMSFPESLMAPEVYGKIHFALTGAESLETILPSFENSFSILHPQHKALYHSLCVMAGNFPQLLWSEIFPEFEKLKLPERAIENYIHQITENFIQLKKKSLTGPLSRRDQSTIEKNLHALNASKLKKIYESFVEVFVP